ncbi:arsenate reductase (glutaredoxin) [Erwinia sp. OLTSP20]|uniref:arsenate reductase (glutaredoxin) n=1 Tax=unclassified Erwinia TaxID=2622719 RepID=UPI000C18D4DB|nr:MULTISPECIES: arsenate reductase (glutaredoxin) [unclassified Erwinia]PIJ51596.1 arsenate reductase (glutaredoxin) [Erwinia sp. OAMSP11]PIJ68912.1 arsenate reductase (glutaredoxin) [Erwinia sp. OLSSP12]PIJ83506.1 arsenate reductase (glutaredoxin) [Erwinia sp. OLCASP19]PIJ83570.1 arsenate reductase (glutaredoxin) [Erwinia sp. OLMDSP33]PIJ86339.1 arsenate reductase (glutaredoxin) [Erwinia sp. OLMTSP26]
MSEVTIYHNPRCSKSRETLALLEAQGIHPHIIPYLTTPPDVTTLNRLLVQLGFSDARQLMRTGESLYKTLNLADPSLSQAALLQAMAQNPTLIERPIVVVGEQAKLGRPPQQVLSLL